MRPQTNSLEFVKGGSPRHTEDLQCLVDRLFGNKGLPDLVSIGEDDACLGTSATKELCLNVRKSTALAQSFTELHDLRRNFRFAFIRERQQGNAKVTRGFTTQRNQLYIGTERDGSKRRRQLTLDFISNRNNSLECVGHAYDAQRSRSAGGKAVSCSKRLCVIARTPPWLRSRRSH
jgi:hypothetical protein